MIAEDLPAGSTVVVTPRAHEDVVRSDPDVVVTEFVSAAAVLAATGVADSRLPEGLLAEAVSVRSALGSKVPPFVWAVTVVLSVVVLTDEVVDALEVLDVVDVVDVPAAGSDASEFDCASGSFADVGDTLETDGVGELAPPAEDTPASEPADEELWPVSSAAATPTCGPVSDTTKSAAPIPAEAAPTFNQRRTPKPSERLARCLPRLVAFELATVRLLRWANPSRIWPCANAIRSEMSRRPRWAPR